MTVTLDITTVRGYETAATGTTTVVFTYTKKDYRVVTLKVSLLDSAGTVKDSKTVDVSTLALNTPTTLTLSFNNGLSIVNAVPTSYVDDSVAAGTSKTYTVASGEIWIFQLLTEGTIKDSKGRAFTAAIAPAPETITVTAPSTAATSVRIFKFSSTAITSYTFSLKFEELDSAGTVLWSQTSTVFPEYPPVSITGAAGDITITQVT